MNQASTDSLAHTTAPVKTIPLAICIQTREISAGKCAVVYKRRVRSVGPLAELEEHSPAQLQVVVDALLDGVAHLV